MTIEELRLAYENAKQASNAAFDADNAARAAFQIAYARELRAKAALDTALAISTPNRRTKNND